MAKEQHLEYAYIFGYEGAIRVNTKTGKQEHVRSYSMGVPSISDLKGDIWASKENTADYESSVIHPKSLLFPMIEVNVGAIKPKKLGRFAELRH